MKNHLVMSWLSNSISDEVGENFLLYGTAKETWDVAREMYSSSKNTLFKIEVVLHDLHQENLKK